ncbi:MAG TPA: ECF-type sigma factor [Phycisphaerales bacterium]|nr:ECF-type sigma factor [Phycisphaerales bacterium]HMP37796.1 ECF-type sigma factor [Phycisphaerales bacterium]
MSATHPADGEGSSEPRPDAPRAPRSAGRADGDADGEPDGEADGRIDEREPAGAELPGKELDPGPAGDVTRALRGREAGPLQGGGGDAELLALVYDQLHAIARRRMAGERSAHTMQATALVNEVYMKLIADGRGGWEDRSQFFRAAAEAMRRILIDHARRRGSAKRGGGKAPMPIDVVDLAAEHDPADILALDEAMQRLESEDARAAEIVRLRFYAGLEVDEVAELTGLSPRTVARDWAFARARLYELLAGT